jgi:Homeodomain-like domain
VVTVEIDPVRVEQRLCSGGLACPGCAGRLTGWGRARTRIVRGPDGPTAVTPRRSRCSRCRVTHVLLPVLLLVRRADTAAVIGAALVARAAGLGHRRIAAELGRPADTVRGWLRRFADRVEAVRVLFTGWCRALDPDPVLPGPTGTAWADALAAIHAAARALRVRFGPAVVGAPVWEVAVAVSAGRLLARGWPAPKAPS